MEQIQSIASWKGPTWVIESNSWLNIYSTQVQLHPKPSWPGQDDLTWMPNVADGRVADYF